MKLLRTPIRATFLPFLALCLALAAWLTWGRLDWHPLAAWLVACNFWVIPLWAFDKLQAKRSKQDKPDPIRVPEMTLHLAAFMGGVLASLLAMFFLRHKTLKPKFKWLYAFFLVLQSAALLWWVFRNRA